MNSANLDVNMFSNFTKLKQIKEAALAAFQKGHFDFDQQTYEGLKQRFPEAAEQIKNLCIQSLRSCKECEEIEHKVEDLQGTINSNPESASELNEFAQGLEDEYYQHLKEMDWAILFDIHSDGSTSVKPLDILSADESASSLDVLSEYIFHPVYTDWLQREVEQRTAAVDTSWMKEVNKVTKPGINVETPYGKVFVHPQKGRRYIKKKDGTIESLPRFLLSLNGVDLPKGQDIHHKDENKLNDSVDNYDYSEHHNHARDHLNFMKKKAKFDIQNGIYGGLRSGYCITVDVNGETIKLKTNNGVRGKDIPCKVSYTDGFWYLAENHMGEFAGDDTKIIGYYDDYEEAFDRCGSLESLIKYSFDDRQDKFLSGNPSTPYYQNEGNNGKPIGSGKGKDLNVHEIPAEELKDGIETEMEEHNVSPEDGLAIALDHEAESMDLIDEAVYYKYIGNIEKMIEDSKD